MQEKRRPVNGSGSSRVVVGKVCQPDAGRSGMRTALLDLWKCGIPEEEEDVDGGWWMDGWFSRQADNASTGHRDVLCRFITWRSR